MSTLTRTAPVLGGLVLGVACAVDLPLLLSGGALLLALATGPATALLLRTPGVSPVRAHVLGLCGDLAVLLLAVQLMLLSVWLPSALVLAYATSVVLTPVVLDERSSRRAAAP